MEVDMPDIPKHELKAALILIPFDSSLNDIYLLGIKEVFEKHGYSCSRVDEEVFQGQIISEIQNRIQASDIIVAETTDKNPNVYYEVGYAHALDKHVILITKDAATLPFDLKGYKHIEYKGEITLLRSELEKQILWIEKYSSRIRKIVRDPKLLRTASKEALLYMYESGEDVAIAEFLEHAKGVLGILNDLRTIGYIKWQGDCHTVSPYAPVYLTEDGKNAAKMLLELRDGSENV